MNIIKAAVVLLIPIMLSACASKDFFFGDYYNAGLDRNICLYNKYNTVFTSRNGKCSFLADTLVGMRSNKESFIVLFSSLGSSTGYSALYDVDKENVDELSAIFINFYKWSKLSEAERISEADKFNNSTLSNSKAAVFGPDIEYTYINKIQPGMNDKNYVDTPLLMLNYHIRYLGIPNNQYWLFTPTAALKFAVMLKRTSLLLK